MINASTPARGKTTKGLIIMTTYNTRSLAAEIIGDEGKSATRTLRKFLRDESSGIDSVGKGGRYSIDMNKRELSAMIKRYKAWEIKQQEEAAKRAEANKPAETPIADNEPIEDEGDEALEGPTDEEIAAMLSDDDEPANIGEDYSI